MLVLAMWATGAVRRTVLWRGTRMRIHKGSALTTLVAASAADALLEAA